MFLTKFKLAHLLEIWNCVNPQHWSRKWCSEIHKMANPSMSKEELPRQLNKHITVPVYQACDRPTLSCSGTTRHTIPLSCMLLGGFSSVGKRKHWGRFISLDFQVAVQLSSRYCGVTTYQTTRFPNSVHHNRTLHSSEKPQISYIYN